VPDHAQIALVTGANKGIGRPIAEQLAGLGMTVLDTAQDGRRGEDAAIAVRLATTGPTGGFFDDDGPVPW
jgi:NAD(P)-dependent dehydrogenase (short-subunit alcohol dehydrogenase family)